ncbi:hypothetical protein D3C81_1101460 [compost metagenome]
MKLASLKSSCLAVLVIRLRLPPVEPAPVKAEPGPLLTSICSMLNTSRVCAATSRMPSTKVSLSALKPRMNGRSLAGLPPSPAPKVIPGVVRSASARDMEPVSLITWVGITVTVFGVSRSGAVYFFEADCSTL